MPRNDHTGGLPLAIFSNQNGQDIRKNHPSTKLQRQPSESHEQQLDKFRGGRTNHLLFALPSWQTGSGTSSQLTKQSQAAGIFTTEITLILEHRETRDLTGGQINFF